MKYLILAAIVLPSVVLAQTIPRVRAPLPIGVNTPNIPQTSQISSEPFPDNYQITLTLTDKEGAPVELSMVVVSSSFTASLGEQNLTFSGSIQLEEAGTLLVQYGLGWQTAVTNANGGVQYLSTSTQGSVRVKPGEEVQILRAGNRVANLAIKKL